MIELYLNDTEYQDLYTETGISPKTGLILQNKTTGRVFLNTEAVKPTTNTNSFIFEKSTDNVKVDSGFNKLWVKGFGSLLIQNENKFIRLAGGTEDRFDVNTPIPVDGDSVYVKDIEEDECDISNFTGSVFDFFANPLTTSVNSTSTNPKIIKIWFKRPTQTNDVCIGCQDLSKNFSNVVIKTICSGDEVFYTKDLSSDDTKRNALQISIPPIMLLGLQIEFHTTDEVGVSIITIHKTGNVASRLQAIKDNGNVTNIGATNRSNLRVSIQEYGDTPSIDAFSRLRVSDNFTLFDSKLLHDKQPLFWDEAIGGSATSTHNATNACVEMEVTTSTSDYVIRQTKQRMNYSPGKSDLIFMTYTCGCDGLSRIGYFDGTGTNNLTPNNGIFFEINDGALSWNICKNGTITESVTQANWNVDILDGSGVSQISYTPSSANILIIDFEWLGVGRVRVGFVVDGIIRYVHYFNHANTVTFPHVYMASPNLPLRYSIQSVGKAAQLDHICGTVISEGGVDNIGVLRSVETGSTHIDANTEGTVYAVLGIKLKDTYKDITVIPESISMIGLSNDNFRWSLLLNPTIGGTAFTYSDFLYSSVQVAKGDTTSVVSNENIVLASGYASSNTLQTEATLHTALRIGTKIDGTADELVLAVMPLGSNADIHASMSFREML